MVSMARFFLPVVQPSGIEDCRTAHRRTLLTGIAKSLMQGSSPALNAFNLVNSELGCVSARIRQAVTSEIPALQQAAMYFFQRGAEGKRIRPTICLLVSSALSASVPPADHLTTVDLRPVSAVPLEVRRRQQRIAEIAELIHVASLLHDDVIDEADTRRGKVALNHFLGNKVAILAGDFLLARASMTLASLKDSEVVSLMSQILEDLISGEILQATASSSSLTMEHYLRKSYLKTASLLANACEAAAVVSNAGPPARRAAHDFGKNVGLAFQVGPHLFAFVLDLVQFFKPGITTFGAGLRSKPLAQPGKLRASSVSALIR
jgi:geranyl diphosphate synthase